MEHALLDVARVDDVHDAVAEEGVRNQQSDGLVKDVHRWSAHTQRSNQIIE
jgi:hypothetical protein